MPVDWDKVGRELVRHEIEVIIHGEPTYIVEVPTTQGEQAAVRRAFWTMWSRLPHLEPEALMVRPYGADGPCVGGPGYVPGHNAED